MEGSKSVFEKNIDRGREKGIIDYDNEHYTYYCKKKYIKLKSPEEIVRASYFCELVLDYRYPADKIDFEVLVPRRKPEDRADIVVHDNNDADYLVVECKKDGITDSEFKQAIEQAFGNANSLRAKYAVVVAGNTKTAFDIAGFKPSEREKNVISDIPEKYGKAPRYKFIKGVESKDLKTVSKDELIRALEKSHDSVWQGGRLAPTTAFDEVSKLLFCKLKDEKDTPKKKHYKFQVGTHETPEEVFSRVSNIYYNAKMQDSEVFKEDIKLEPKVVYSVIEHLQELAISKIDLDTKGVAFEKFMEDFFRGKMGQYFTPREIISFCVRMTNPKKNQLILDPACGSGGFLLYALDNVKRYAENQYDEDEAKEHWHNFAMKNLYGIDINDQIARVCKMNMIIHDDGHTNIVSSDALKPINDIASIHNKFKKDNFDIILTNPPFGAIIKSSEKDYLDNYYLGKKRINQKTEILFIERCFEFLKPSGKLAIVLPDGILTNSTLQYVRDFIMDHAQIEAVVSLPPIAFSHFGAGVKSSLVFVRKKMNDEQLENYPIFMAIAEHIGYDATGRKDPINDLDKILDEYRKFEKQPTSYEGC
jgi:type I restriction enzyme M protein